MKCKWKYFIILNIEDTSNIVEDKIDDELLVCCDVAVASENGI